VPTGQSHQCSIVAGEWEKKPAGALGAFPYASADYAKATLKTFPECKGGSRTRRRTKNIGKNESTALAPPTPIQYFHYQLLAGSVRRLAH
jgi:hypothetical protein